MREPFVRADSPRLPLARVKENQPIGELYASQWLHPGVVVVAPLLTFEGFDEKYNTCNHEHDEDARNDEQSLFHLSPNIPDQSRLFAVGCIRLVRTCLLFLLELPFPPQVDGRRSRPEGDTA